MARIGDYELLTKKSLKQKLTYTRIVCNSTVYLQRL